MSNRLLLYGKSLISPTIGNALNAHSQETKLKDKRGKGFKAIFDKEMEKLNARNR